MPELRHAVPSERPIPVPWQKSSGCSGRSRSRGGGSRSPPTAPAHSGSGGWAVGRRGLQLLDDWSGWGRGCLGGRSSRPTACCTHCTHAAGRLVAESAGGTGPVLDFCLSPCRCSPQCRYSNIKRSDSLLQGGEGGSRRGSVYCCSSRRGRGYCCCRGGSSRGRRTPQRPPLPAAQLCQLCHQRCSRGPCPRVLRPAPLHQRP
jgi:hypothetical protein